MHRRRSHLGRLALPVLLALAPWLGLWPGCSGKKKAAASRTAPTRGVVGKVLSVQGAVTYSAAPAGKREPLRAGMELRAEWTVHTADDAKITARLRNGHLWTLSGGLSKQVHRIHALTLAPTMAGALETLADLGAPEGKDRSAAAGLHQERTAAGKAAPTRPPTADDLDETRLQEAPERPAPGPMEAEKRTTTAGKKPPKKRNVTSQYARRPRKVASKLRSSARPRASMRSVSRASRPPGGGARHKPSASLQSLLSRASMGKSKSSSGGSSANLPRRLSRSEVHPGVTRLMSLFRSCLRQQKVRGTLRVRITIRGATGRVSALTVSGRSASDPVVRCMRRRSGSVRFRKFAQATQTVTFPVKAP